MRALGAEIEPNPVLAAERARGVGLLGLAGPAGELRKDVALDNAGRDSRQSSQGKKRYQGSKVAPGARDTLLAARVSAKYPIDATWVSPASVCRPRSPKV